MVSPVCVRCHQPINHDHLQFEGERPVHKSCWGKEQGLPQADLPQVFSYMTVEEFVGRCSIAMTILLLGAMALL
jgi:hypothetical protein